MRVSHDNNIKLVYQSLRDGCAAVANDRSGRRVPDSLGYYGLAQIHTYSVFAINDTPVCLCVWEHVFLEIQMVDKPILS